MAIREVVCEVSELEQTVLRLCSMVGFSEYTVNL